MDEVLPVLSGIAVGLILGSVPSRLRMLALGVCSAALGILASWMSGELAISWIYVLIDVAQVLGTALVTAVLVVRRRHRVCRVP